MSGRTLNEISLLEAKCADLMRRMDARVNAANTTGTPQQAKEAQDWRKTEHDALEDWKEIESMVLQEWRARESLGMEEWKVRQQISTAFDHAMFEIAREMKRDKRTYLETEIDRLEMRCQNIIAHIDDQANDVLYSLRPDQQRQTDEMERRHKTKPNNRQLELWTEIRRLEELAKRQQVQRMLQKGELITEIDQRIQKEKEDQEYREFLEQEERVRKEKEERQLKSRERERQRTIQSLLIYLSTCETQVTMGTPSSTSSSKMKELSPAFLLTDNIHKAKVSLEVRRALLLAFRFLDEISLVRSCSCVSREFHQMLRDERLANDRMTNMKARLEEIGILFVKVPPSTYILGKPPDITPDKVCDKQSNNTSAPYFSDTVRYTQPHDVYLTEGLITVSLWKRLVTALPHLRSFVTEKDIELCRYNIIHASISGNREATVIERDVQDADPAIELPYEKCAAIAKALSAQVPSWQQWEAAVRGPEAHVYVWGDHFDPVRVETDVMMHCWAAPNPNYGKPNLMGLRDTAREVHQSLALSRLNDWGPYKNSTSVLGLKDLCRFGKEWNSARRDVVCHDPEDRVNDCVLRSACDLHSVNDIHSWDTPVQEALLASNHRAFSGPMAFCLRPPKHFGGGKIAPRAAFRIAFDFVNLT